MPRAARIAAWSVGGLILLVLVGIAVIVVFGNTAGGRRLLESETAKLTSGRVLISGLGGKFPSDIELASLELRDPKGAWMSARGISVHWSPLTLLGWDMHIESIGISAADVLRRPVSSPASRRRSSSSSSTPAIDIDQLRIGTLTLAPAAAGLPVRLNVRGNLHYKSLSDARGSLVARRTNGMGDYEVSFGVDHSRMQALVKLEEPAGGPLEHLLSLPGLGALSVIASVEGPRNAEKLALSAQAGPLSASADGTLDLIGRAADLTYSASSPAMSPRPGLAWRRIALRGRWLGPESAPEATGVLDLEGLELSDGAQLGSLQAHLDANGRVLKLHATADGIVLTGSQPHLLQDGPVDVDATWQLAATGRPLDLTVRHRLLDLDVQAITTGARSANFDLHLLDLHTLAAAYHEDMCGTMSLSGKIAEQGRTTTLDVSGTGDLGGASVAARLLGDGARLHIAGSMTPANIHVDTLDVSGKALSVSAYGSAERSGPGTASSMVQSVRAHWRVSLPKLAVLWPSVGGSLETTGSADGPLQSLTADVQAQSTIAVPGAPPGKVQASLQARGLPSAPNAAVRANGTFDGAPLRLEASLERAAGNKFHVVIPRLAWKSLAINGDLTAGRNLAAARGSMHLRMASLADLQALTRQRLQGGIAADVDLTSAPGGPRARLDLVANNIVAGSVSGDARLSAAGPLDGLRVQLSALSPDLDGKPASLSAGARLDATRRVLDLDRLQARYQGQTLHLIAPSRVIFASGISVRNLQLGAQKAIVSVDGELSPALDFRASIQHVDAALVDAFVPHLLAQGTFDANAQLRGTRAAPVGRASLQLTGLKLANDAAQGLPAVNMRGSAHFGGQSARVFAELDAGSTSRLTMSGRAPLDTTGPVALRMAGRMDVALMNSILEARGERASGILTVRASIAGTAHEPRIRGTVVLANGDVRDYTEGVHLENVNARLVGGRGVLRLASMTARAGPGQLSATGTVGVLQPGMPIDISLKAHKIQPITNDILTANLDTHMKVAGTLKKRLDVTGEIHVNHASISIPNGLPPNVQTLDVVRPGQAPQPVAPATPRLVIGLDVTLDAPAAIFVQGRGLDAQLGGQLKVSGTSDNPQVNGGFRMIRGAFSLAGTNLNFTRGEVSFNGEGLKGRIDPSLDFVAQSSVVYTAPTTVTLSVTGFADAPKIALSSSPSLPQDDLLALLLFGKPASQLSAVQLAETGAALASLSGLGPGGGGGGSKWNPLTWIKKAFGLNTLSVGSASPPGGAAAGGGTQSSGASLTAGKYVSKRVYLAATQTTNGTSQVQVDVDISQYLKLQTRLGNGTATAQGTTPENDPGSSIGLAWQMPY